MSRTGIEPKPRWQSIPPEVRQAAEEVLGVRVRRGARVWGGYTPTPTYRLRLADGRGAFLKAVGPADGEFARAAHQREERVYQELSHLIAPWAPAFYGAFHHGEWLVMLLEDLGPKSAPPWSPHLIRQVSRSIGDFHRSTLGANLPEWLPRLERRLLSETRVWQWEEGSPHLRALAGLAGERSAEAACWLAAMVPTLSEACRPLPDIDDSSVLVHNDLRSDNLRWVGGRLRLFDWPHVGVGTAEFDAAAFAQSVTVEGGPEPERVMAWYAERAPVRPKVLDAAVALIAGFFADLAWRPDIPGLPRVRGFQRRQLRVTLAWASRRLGLPEPEWLAGVPD